MVAPFGGQTDQKSQDRDLHGLAEQRLKADQEQRTNRVLQEQIDWVDQGTVDAVKIGFVGVMKLVQFVQERMLRWIMHPSMKIVHRGEVFQNRERQDLSVCRH